MRRIVALGTLLAVAPLSGALAEDGNAEAGKRVFNQCMACHTINEGGPNRVGPNLHGVIGRKAATKEGFKYSAAMQKKGEENWVWSEENLHPYLRNPREVVPGTQMAFPGLRNDTQLNDVIAYIKSESTPK